MVSVRKGGGCCIPYNGVPFMIGRTRVLGCKHGKDRNIRAKERWKAAKENDHNQATKRRKIIKDTIKLDCPSKLHIKEITRYPEYEVKENTRYCMQVASQKLREDLKNGSTVVAQEEVYVLFSPLDSHRNHSTPPASLQPVDKDIRTKSNETEKEVTLSFVCQTERQKEVMSFHDHQQYNNSEGQSGINIEDEETSSQFHLDNDIFCGNSSPVQQEEEVLQAIINLREDGEDEAEKLGIGFRVQRIEHVSHEKDSSGSESKIKRNAVAVRDVLKQLSNATYLIKDGTFLEEMLQISKDLLTMAMKSVPKDDNCPSHVHTTVKHRRKTAGLPEQIPARKKQDKKHNREHPYSGRVDAMADTRIRHVGVRLPLPQK